MEALPKRKHTRLPGYDYSTPGAYFVTVCTRDKACLFWESGPHYPVGAGAGADDIRERRADDIRPYEDLSTVIGQMKRWASARSGFPLWQRSYYDHIIRGDADYREIWEYIENNPARWCEDCFFPAER